MAILIAYYSRAGENYFGGSYRRIPVGNTRRVAEQLLYHLGRWVYLVDAADDLKEDTLYETSEIWD